MVDTQRTKSRLFSVYFFRFLKAVSLSKCQIGRALFFKFVRVFFTLRERAMAVEARPELVGKRFLCVSGEELLELGEIGRWRWRAGVIRAVTLRDNDNTDLTVGTSSPHIDLGTSIAYIRCSF